jgi:hypothetical protein
MAKKLLYWPSCRYAPDGEGGFKSEIFQKEEDVPEGWVDSPSKVMAPVEEKSAPKTKRRPRKPKAKKPAADPVIAAARSEALRTLREAGVDIGDEATDDDISEALEALE